MEVSKFREKVNNAVKNAENELITIITLEVCKHGGKISLTQEMGIRLDDGSVIIPTEVSIDYGNEELFVTFHFEKDEKEFKENSEKLNLEELDTLSFIIDEELTK